MAENLEKITVPLTVNKVLFLQNQSMYQNIKVLISKPNKDGLYKLNNCFTYSII